MSGARTYLFWCQWLNVTFSSLYKLVWEHEWVLNVSSGDKTWRGGQLFVLDRKFPPAASCSSGRDLYSPLSTKKSLVFDVALLQTLSKCRPIVLDSDVWAAVSTLNSSNDFWRPRQVAVFYDILCVLPLYSIHYKKQSPVKCMKANKQWQDMSHW